jgi:delta 1-pyrroline-5-carboxylate dehydrogenase
VHGNIVSTNPGRNYEMVGEERVATADDIPIAVRQAHAAHPDWQALGVAGRVKALGPVGKTGGKYGFRDACRVKVVCLRK